MKNKKTTIAISLENRKKLQDIKLLLEKRRQHFVDMDEVITEIIEKYLATL